MLSTKMVDFNFKNNPTFTRPLTGGATWSEGAFLRPLGGAGGGGGYVQKLGKYFFPRERECRCLRG